MLWRPRIDGTYLYKAESDAHQEWILNTPNGFEPHCEEKIIENRNEPDLHKRQIRVSHKPNTRYPEPDVNLNGVDELHKFKSPDAQPWKLIDQLGKNMFEKGVPEVVGLTGTLMRN